jgi:hypothetical protein
MVTFLKVGFYMYSVVCSSVLWIQLKSQFIASSVLFIMSAKIVMVITESEKLEY